MSLVKIFNALFWGKYKNLDYNYYNDIVIELEENEIKSLLKWFVIKKKINTKTKKDIYVRIALPKTQQNNGNISCFITMTHNWKRMSYHWIFFKDNWKTNNYGIRKYKNLWKNNMGYDDFEALGEECFKWHSGRFNGEKK